MRSEQWNDVSKITMSFSFLWKNNTDKRIFFAFSQIITSEVNENKIVIFKFFLQDFQNILILQIASHLALNLIIYEISIVALLILATVCIIKLYQFHWNMPMHFTAIIRNTTISFN